MPLLIIGVYKYDKLWSLIILILIYINLIFNLLLYFGVQHSNLSIYLIWNNLLLWLNLLDNAYDFINAKWVKRQIKT